MRKLRLWFQEFLMKMLLNTDPRATEVIIEFQYNEGEQIMTPHDNGFIIVPNKVGRDKDISSNAKLLCGIIFSFSKNDPRVFAKNEYYAEYLGISQNSVTRLITDLVEKGYLYREVYKNSRKQVIARFLWITDKVRWSVQDVKRNIMASDPKEYVGIDLAELKKIWTE